MDQILKEKFDQTPHDLLGPVDQFRIRCPECLKLYAVNTSQVTESRPRFQCVDCQTKFWISYPEVLSMGDEVLAYPLSWLEEGEAQQAPTPKETPKAASAANVAREVSQITTKAFSCPKCGHGYAAGDSECEKCGVVFMKIKEKSQAPSYSASIEVRELWDAVLEDYDNFEKHQNFINAASADRSLEYAAEHYAKILEVCPQDELAQKAQKEVNALAFARFESQIVKNGPSKNSFFGDIPLSFRKFRLTSFVIFLCAVVIATGIILPHQRNLVGAGTSVMFFIFALRYFFRVL